MEKQKRWQLYLIIAVIALTLYNILPTIFFYTKPLKSPVDETRANAISEKIVGRVNELEEDSIEWLQSFTKHIGVHPSSIKVDDKDSSLIMVHFESQNEANLFRRLLPSAGALIPFVPSQLEVYGGSDEDLKSVIVLRQIGFRLQDQDIPTLFKYSTKYDKNGAINSFYRNIVDDRVSTLALSFGGESQMARRIQELQSLSDEEAIESASQIAKEIIDAERALGRSDPIFKRWLKSFGLTNAAASKELITGFIAKSELLQGALSRKEETLNKELKQAIKNEELIDGSIEDSLKIAANQKKALNDANEVLKRNSDLFAQNLKPLTETEIDSLLKESIKASKVDARQTISLKNTNPFVEALIIDWSNDKISLEFYPDIQKIRSSIPSSEAESYVKDKVGDLIINDIARASSISDESIQPSGDTFAVSISTLTSPYALLALDLGALANKMGDQFLHQIKSGWSPTHPDLTDKNYPISTYEEYKKLSKQDQKLGLLVYVPAVSQNPLPDLKKGSIYIIAKGLDSIASTYRDNSKAENAEAFSKDVKQLTEMLKRSGFIGYPGSSLGGDSPFAKDYIFELEDYYSNLVKATRENFTVKGSKRYAVLDLTDVEQRILAENKIEDRMQEDLLKWKDEYQASLVSQNPNARLLVPPPTENPYWQNFKISLAKYFRGDDRKILKWGLDLSGGKTVRIGLKDSSGQTVTNPDDLKQAVNELYTRINKMGVSERTIRIENNNIILDFPSSQGLSAAELIKASAMHFHIVNEKFSTTNPEMREAISTFLQQVWNEAVVTNRKDIESINEIAWKHLGGDEVTDTIQPRGENAKFLFENGLRLANLRTQPLSHAFDDTLSSIGMIKGDDFSEWFGQTNPLMVVFHNYALEGASLTDVQVGYDPKDGNALSFQVKGSYDNAEGNPRTDFYAWTSEFSQDQIRGTPKASYTRGEGWRMAVILNGRIISMPSLKAALRDGGSISGRFSQREIDQLAADLKAGSLSFTPRILSEQNVSPELGKEERTKGIFASIIAICLVVALMCGYYRFAGLVACIAVFFNILIMWGVLQNLGAALTLPGIAGIVLTIGMAVDANVLVFERYKEEFKISGRVGPAIQAAYSKAFSAIVDSNVTTIIAALILLQFDSGPIKGFAVTLIIGIISSMFTALFMTRYFFTGWVKRNKDKPLKMSDWIGKTNFNFLAQTKKAVITTFIVLLLGSYFFISQRNNIFGMDFLGGYALTVELKEDPAIDSYRLDAKEALVNAGLQSNEVDVRQLSRPNQLKIELSTALEEPGRVFHGMPETLENPGSAYLFEHNPRLTWIVEALNKAGLSIPDSQLKQLDSNWTVMSGQFSDAMRNNAIIALFLALVSILIYITLRFEFKYAISAVIGLAHDVLITLGIIALFNKLGFPVQINLEIVGAIMTIIGYSLNDTIIIFDRIREELKLHRKWKFEDVVNYALNITLSRTMMTSGSTLLVLLALVLFGGQSIFGFALVMTIGVIVGTLSSLFIAAPVLIYFHNREEHQTEDKSALKPT